MHDFDLIDICVLIAVTSLAPILLVTVWLLFARGLGPRALTWAYGLAVLTVGSLGFWQLLRGTEFWLPLRAAIAILAGGLCLVALLRSQLIAGLAKTGAWAGVISPVLFLLDPGVSLVYSGSRGADEPLPALSSAETHPPVVLVIFDELPLWTLVGQDGRINRFRYPNFSRLAEQATWFPNASTVNGTTTYAIPAIVTGRYPKKAVAAANASAFPDNPVA